MAEQLAPLSEPINQDQVESIKSILWGKEIKCEVFRRWTQGIEFSEHEPTAIVQYEGGPCAVIAPLQAFILKNLLFSRSPQTDWRFISVDERNSILCQAVADMLSLVSSQEMLTLIEHIPPPPLPPRAPSCGGQASNESSPTKKEPPPGVPDRDQPIDPGQNTSSSSSEPPPDVSANATSEETETSPVQQNGPLSRKSKEIDSLPDASSTDEAGPKKKRLSHEEFHSVLRCRRCNSRNLIDNLQEWLPNFQQEYGVLLLLYSIIYSKGIQQIKNEMEDPSESLIDGTFGHGSQSLINLLITGRAVSNVWDNDKDVSGLKLYGIDQQSTIGFLTQLEHLRYCEVGWYLKNPKVPVWLLGSETHLTVLFSLEKNLVLTESPEAEARRVFCNFDPEGCGFVPGDRLGDLMEALNLVSEPDYVKLMRDKLDPEQLGIITQNSFLEEFFPSDGEPQTVQQFILMHYNGQPRSCPENKVIYAACQAEIQEFPELQIITDTSPMKTCLMTKWPTLELKWNDNVIPSLN